MKMALRNRFNSALTRNYKTGSAIQDLGCSILEFKLYIENYFSLYPGMCWDNYGSEWNIDHFLPLSSFNLTDRTQLLEACHWTNLQPMWKKENSSKYAKLP